MARPCSVCTHPDVNAINTVLLNGSSQRAVARTFGVTPSAVQRHVTSRHIPDLLDSVSKRVEAVEGEQLVSEAIGLYERSLALLTEAEHAGTLKERATCNAEVRRNLETLTKLTILAPAALQGGSSERVDIDAELERRIGATRGTPPPHDPPSSAGHEEGKAALTPLALEAGPPRGGGGSTSSAEAAGAP